MTGKPKYDHTLILKLLDEKIEPRSIAARLGCSATTVSLVKAKRLNPDKYVQNYKKKWQKYRLIKNKKPEDRWKKTKPRRHSYDEIYLKFKEGKTVKDLSCLYTYSPCTIRRIINLKTKENI